MNRIFIVPNYHTLYTAFCMIEKGKNLDDKSIILTYGFIDPSKIYDTAKIQFIKMDRCKANCTSSYKYFYYCTNFDTMITKLRHLYDENCEFFFFLDQAIEMQVAQGIVKKKFRKSKLFLVEEGLSLYWQEHADPEPSFLEMCKQRSIYKALRRLVVLGTMSLLKKLYSCQNRHYTEPGLCLYIDEIICKYPDKLHSSVRAKKLIHQQELQLYNPINAKFFLSEVLHIDIKKMKIYDVDYLYLGGPYSEERLISPAEEKEFITNLLRRLPIGSNLLIKPHGADSNQKYEEFKNCNFLNIYIANHLAYLPIECLYFVFGCPVVLSPCSVALLEIKTTYPEAEEYALYQLANFNFSEKLDESLFTDLKIIIPHTWEDFVDKISNSRKGNSEHIPAYSDSESGFTRTRFRQHSDSNPDGSGQL